MFKVSLSQKEKKTYSQSQCGCNPSTRETRESLIQGRPWLHSLGGGERVKTL